MALASGMAEHSQQPNLQLREFPRGVPAKLRVLITTELRNALRIVRSDVLVVHSALSLSLVSILLARALGRPVVGFVWDLYPESTRIMGNIRNPFLLAMYSILERCARAALSTVIISSEDYRPYLGRDRHRAIVLPLWPCDPVRPVSPLNECNKGVVRIVFAGQLNAIRGLQSGIRSVVDLWPESVVEVHVFSRDSVPGASNLMDDAGGRLAIVEHGFVPPDQLQATIQSMDLGWVCLDPDFELPAFPSKVMAYLCAGLPILYTGPEMDALEAWIESNQFGLCAQPGRPLTTDDVWRLRAGFERRRDAYFASMAKDWFSLAGLL